jgi:hypothetical protein
MALISFGVYLDPHQEEFGDYGNAAVTTETGTTTPQSDTEGPVPLIFVLNRGRNTGAGQSYVYWQSPTSVDSPGSYYPTPNPSGVPFSQLADVIQAAKLRT